MQTNIAVPALPVGKQTLYFLPERLLVFEANAVGAVNYADLEIDVTQTRFIENEGVPFDASVVGQTWRYVNKKGGPDRRFGNSQQLPIAVYEQWHFKSDSGLNELIQVSRVGVGEKLRNAVLGLRLLTSSSANTAQLWAVNPLGIVGLTGLDDRAGCAGHQLFRRARVGWSRRRNITVRR